MMVGRNLLDIQEGKEGAGLAIRDDDGIVRVFFLRGVYFTYHMI